MIIYDPSVFVPKMVRILVVSSQSYKQFKFFFVHSLNCLSIGLWCSILLIHQCLLLKGTPSALFPWPLRHFGNQIWVRRVWWYNTSLHCIMVSFHTIMSTKQTMPPTPLVQTVATWLHNSNPKQVLANGNPDKSQSISRNSRHQGNNLFLMPCCL